MKRSKIQTSAKSPTDDFTITSVPPSSLSWSDVYPDELYQAELAELSRQGRFDTPSAGSEISDQKRPPPGKIALALSGGGIRSATFCLGVLQHLASSGVLRKIDFLSTVSGGGYIGSFLGQLFMRQPASEVPTKEEREATHKRISDYLQSPQSGPLLWLRESARHLSPNGQGDTFLAGAVFVRNWAAVQVVLNTTVLTCFLLFESLRAFLANFGWWVENVECPLALAAGSYLWWSPSIILPLGCLCISIAYGGAYWITQQPIALPIAVTAGWSLTSFYASLWVPRFFNSFNEATVKWALVFFSVAPLSSLIVWWLYSTFARVQKKDIRWLRNALSQHFRNVFFATVGFLLLAVITAFGQSLYALIIITPTMIVGLKSLGTITGVAAIITAASRLNVLAEKLKGFPKTKISLTALATVAAAGLAFVHLVILSALSSAVVWRWAAPVVYCNSMDLPMNPGLSLLETLTQRTDVRIKAASYQSTNNAVELPQFSSQFGLTNGAFFGPFPHEAGASGGSAIVGRVSIADEPTIKPRAQSGEAWAYAGEKKSETDDSYNPMNPALCAIFAGFGLLLTIGFGHTMSFLNLSSHQTLYTARLVRAYLGASNPERNDRKNRRLSDAIAGDDTPFADYKPHRRGAPLHILNVTINSTVSGETQMEVRDRKGVSMAVAPCGISVGRTNHALWVENAKLDDTRSEKTEPIQDTGIPTRNADQLRVSTAKKKSNVRPIKKKTGETAHAFGDETLQPTEALSLGNWMGISGAAFGTGTGSHNNIGLSFVQGMVNLRLGYWWDSYLSIAQLRKKTGNSKTGLVSGLFPVQAHLLDEFLARFQGHYRRRWYLSDGGHFENTGAYELLRRRIPLIIVCDCGADPSYDFEDFADLVRKARLDFGAEVEFVSEADKFLERDLPSADPLFTSRKILLEIIKDGASKSLASDPGEFRKSLLEQPKGILAKVIYPTFDQGSLLFLVKPSINPGLSFDIMNYRQKNPAFPQEPTSDQYFDEAQWESYRKLGESIASELFQISRVGT